ncbi:MAG: 2-amino-4-hydroxy-6-hydroxymethyldihydropteridine diphosphokinase [Ginsengibacter sp.]
MNIIYVLVGGNMGNRRINLETALSWLEKEIGNVNASSLIYETEAWGNNDQPDFYNQVHIIHTRLSAEEAMKYILDIEEKMGRVRTIKNAARIIDIDILFFNAAIINEPGLTVPHPEIANRRFVLVPLDELSPGFVHPILHKTIHELLSTCKDELEVKPVSTS